MKHWWRYSSAWALIASTTGANRCPVFWQPMPPAKSMNVRPSTSVTRAPSACETTSFGIETPALTYRDRSARMRSWAETSVVEFIA